MGELVIAMLGLVSADRHCGGHCAKNSTFFRRWSCSITEEANETGEEDGGSTQDTASTIASNDNNNDSPTSTPSPFSPDSVTTLAHIHPDLLQLDSDLPDSDER